MTLYRLFHVPSGREAALVERADGWISKGWGVLGRRSLTVGAGLWLPGVASVHTVGVRFALDLLFLDAKLRTVCVKENVQPGRLWVGMPGAAHTLEIGVGTLAALERPLCVGEEWRLEREEAGD